MLTKKLTIIRNGRCIVNRHKMILWELDRGTINRGYLRIRKGGGVGPGEGEATEGKAVHGEIF